MKNLRHHYNAFHSSHNGISLPRSPKSKPQLAWEMSVLYRRKNCPCFLESVWELAPLTGGHKMSFDSYGIKETASKYLSIKPLVWCHQVKKIMTSFLLFYTLNKISFHAGLCVLICGGQNNVCVHSPVGCQIFIHSSLHLTFYPQPRAKTDFLMT